MSNKKLKILFICLGNICRSPMAEGIFQYFLDKNKINRQILIDSAGTAAWHIGKKPDSRGITTLNNHMNIDISHQHARKIDYHDFMDFDLIFAMDRENYADLKDYAAREYHKKIKLYLDFTLKDNTKIKEVPDPYYGSGDGFVQVMELLVKASENLIDMIKNDKL